MADEVKKTAEESGATQDMSADLPLPKISNQKSTQKSAQPQKNKIPVGRWNRFHAWYVSHKKLSIPLSVLAFLLLVLALPFTRYPVAGFVISKDFVVQVNDSESNEPVSGADIVLVSGVSEQTDGNGRAKFHVGVGNYSLEVNKKYYSGQKTHVLVPFHQKTTPSIKLVATGRQVKINVKNGISKQTLQNVDIKVLDITAKTDKDGKALIVLPAGTSSQKANLSFDGYNSSEVTIKVSDTTVAQNDFTLTPAGKVYFLSKLSGKIDVVKTNLDGSGRETVLAGTGKEDNQNTVLLASRDWKYLALLSRRDSDLAKLYMIETGTDKVTAVDEGNATFSLIGWSDSNFVYQVDRLDYQIWQPKQEALKSYNAATKKITLLDETDAQGSNNFDGVYETFHDVFIVGQRAVYTKAWFSNYSTNDFGDAQLGIYSINVTGSGGRATHKSFGYETGKSTYLQALPSSPGQIYYQVTEKSAQPKYYVFANSQVSEKPTAKDALDSYFNGNQYNTYLLSPSGKSTFWSESRDGKNSLFVGDGSGGNGQQIASLSDYQSYGWFSDDYLLVSKNGSELYTLGAGGIKKDSDATKITDYHKPVVNYPGYGGGYGGL